MHIYIYIYNYFSLNIHRTFCLNSYTMDIFFPCQVRTSKIPSVRAPSLLAAQEFVSFCLTTTESLWKNNVESCGEPRDKSEWEKME